MDVPTGYPYMVGEKYVFIVLYRSNVAVIVVNPEYLNMDKAHAAQQRPKPVSGETALGCKGTLI